MTSLFRRLALLGFLSWLGLPFLFASDASPRHFGVGLNFGGGQIDWRPSPKWMLELRAQQGTEKSDNLETKSQVFGFRGYRFFRCVKSPSPYLGIEVAAVNAKQSSSSYKANGMSVGAYGGLGFHLSSHFLLSFDIGPYFISLREEVSQINRSEMDIVGDTSLIYFF